MTTTAAEGGEWDPRTRTPACSSRSTDPPSCTTPAQRRRRHRPRRRPPSGRTVAPQTFQRPQETPDRSGTLAAGRSRHNTSCAGCLPRRRPGPGRDRTRRPRRSQRRDRLCRRRPAPTARHRIGAHRGTNRRRPRSRHQRDQRPRRKRQPRRYRPAPPRPTRARHPLRGPRTLHPRGNRVTEQPCSGDTARRAPICG